MIAEVKEGLRMGESMDKRKEENRRVKKAIFYALMITALVPFWGKLLMNIMKFWLGKCRQVR